MIKKVFGWTPRNVLNKTICYTLDSSNKCDEIPNELVIVVALFHRKHLFVYYELWIKCYASANITYLLFSHSFMNMKTFFSKFLHNYILEKCTIRIFSFASPTAYNNIKKCRSSEDWNLLGKNNMKWIV